MKLAVVIGVYDERETIGELTRRLTAVLDGMPGWRWELIYVVEGEDGSREIALDLARERPEIWVLYQRERGGLGGAFRRGFAAAPADADFVVTMDADLNHQPEEIPRLVEAAVREGADIVIGSRFVAGGKSEGTPLWKLTLSRTLNLLMRGFFGLAVRDKTSGFRVYRRPLLAGLRYRNNDFAFLPEILVEARRQGLRVREEPIHFVYRRQGRSKMGFWATVFSYLSLFGRADDPEAAAVGRRPARELWRAAAPVLVVLLAFFASLEIAHPFYFLQDDNRDEHLPLFVLSYRTLSSGDVAQFNFHQALGTPLLATGQPAVLSPAPYLAIAASRIVLGHEYAAVDLLVIAYFLLGALGMLALSRELALSPAAGALAALSWPLLPVNVYFSVSWGIVAPLVGCLPWLVALCIRVVRGAGGMASVVALACAHTILFLAGYPPWLAEAGVVELIVVAFFIVGSPRRSSAALRLALAAVLAGLLSLPLLAPMAHQASRSLLRGAAMSYRQFTAEALRPVTWANGVLWPFSRWREASPDHFYTEIGSPAGLSHLGYPGLALAAFALAGLARRRWHAADRRRAWLCAALAVVSLAWAFGWLSPVIHRVPILNRFRWPMRLLLFFEFAAVLLAAIGLDEWRRRLGMRAAAAAAAVILALQISNLWLANLLHGKRGFVAHSDPVPLSEPWRERLARGRIVSLGHYALGGRVDTLRSLGFNYASLWGLFHMGGYDPLTTKESYRATRGFSFSSSFAAEPAKLEVPFLRGWGVRWYVASPGAVKAYAEWLAQHGIRLVECDADRCLFEDPAAPPLAAWADSGQDDGIGLRVEGADLRVDVRRPEAGDLVLAFLEQPFLNATIDGRAAPMRRLPAGQIVLAVPAGEHVLRLRYDDPWFRLGRLGFAGGLVLTAALAVIERRARRGDRAAAGG